MDSLDGLKALLVVAAISAIAPILAALVPKRRVPQIVLLILGGILVGPHGLGLEATTELHLIANVGLGFVFLLAGFELDIALLFERPGRLGVVAWVISAAASAVLIGGLAAVGFVHAFVPVALALTTTALGTVLPILRESGMIDGGFGRYFMAAGAIGEMFPIVAIAVFLGVNSRLYALISLAAVGGVALALAAISTVVRRGRLAAIVSAGADTTAQTTLRWSILLLLALLVLAGQFGLDVVLGAFVAGAVLRRWAPADFHSIGSKLDAIGYGFFIPVFFVTAGMGVDVASIRQSPGRLLAFLALLLVVRGAPVLIVYRYALQPRQRVQLMLCTATTLPIIVALTQIGLSSGTMLPENAAALVGAGVLSVLLFPLIAVGLKPAAEGDAAAVQQRKVLPDPHE